MLNWLLAAALTLRIFGGNFSTAPATLRVIVHADDGAQLELVVDGEDYYRSSTEALAGRKTVEFEFRDVPAGSYIVAVFTADRYGKILKEARTLFTVI